MIIDFHAHLERDPESKTYLVADLEEDTHYNKLNLRLISALEGKNVRSQNQAVRELVQTNPDKYLGCAIVNPKEDDSIEQVLEIASQPEFRAIEFDSLEHGYLPEAQQQNIDEILKIAEGKQWVIKVFTGKGFQTIPGQWVFYSQRFPNLNFVFLHMGTNDFGYNMIEQAAQHENIFMETSYQYELPILRKAFKRLPPERFIFGSNYPVNLTYASINVFNVLELPKETQRKLFYENAKRLLKL
mgnify:FL=1